MPKLFNKKVLIISLIVLPLFILMGLIFYFLYQKQPKIAPPLEVEQSEREKIISQQLKELDELRQRMGVQPLSEKEKQAQIKELDALYKQSGGKPLSQEQIQKPAQEGRGSLNEIERQLEELDKLRLER